MPKNISLVLGSGGARGLAHIGIIQWLEKHGYQIRAISGCSIGALVGGVYTAGKLDEFEAWIISIDRFSMAKLLDIAWESSGVFKGDRIIQKLVNLIGDFDIEDLPIPFTAEAADIAREKEVWLNSGSLFDAIRASISLPLFFTPYEINGAKLIDGGILNPVPIAPTFDDGTELTIAVNLGGPVTETRPIEPEHIPPVDQSLRARIANYIDDIQESFASSFASEINAFDVANQAFDTMQSAIARDKLAAYPPDKIIEIPRNVCGILEFDRADEMITLGYQRAGEVLKPV